MTRTPENRRAAPARARGGQAESNKKDAVLLLDSGSTIAMLNAALAGLLALAPGATPDQTWVAGRGAELRAPSKEAELGEADGEKPDDGTAAPLPEPAEGLGRDPDPAETPVADAQVPPPGASEDRGTVPAIIDNCEAKAAPSKGEEAIASRTGSWVALA